MARLVYDELSMMNPERLKAITNFNNLIFLQSLGHSEKEDIESFEDKELVMGYIHTFRSVLFGGWRQQQQGQPSVTSAPPSHEKEVGEPPEDSFADGGGGIPPTLPDGPGGGPPAAPPDGGPPAALPVGAPAAPPDEGPPVSLPDRPPGAMPSRGPPTNGQWPLLDLYDGDEDGDQDPMGWDLGPSNVRQQGGGGAVGWENQPQGDDDNADKFQYSMGLTTTEHYWEQQYFKSCE